MKAQEILAKAEEAGAQAFKECRPVPMKVYSGGTVHVVDDGVCGFASVVILCKNTATRTFIKELKKVGLAGDVNSFCKISKHAFQRGFYYWVSSYSQSMERKYAFAKAFAEELQKHDIYCYATSRLD